jgi:hypothetical protein
MDAAEIQRRAGEAAAGLRTMGRRATENAFATLLTALAAGFLVGLLLRFFERPRNEKK